MSTQTHKGSIMLFTLVTLTMLLLISVTVTATINSQARSAISTDRTVTAFSIAESGAEIVLDAIYTGNYNSSALSNLGSSCNQGVLSGNLDSGEWEVILYDVDGDALTSCSDTNWRTEADTLKSDGTHVNTIRSIRMSIEPF